MRCKDITTRCGSMLNVGMRLPRKSRDKTRTLHTCVCYVLCDLIIVVCIYAWLIAYDEVWKVLEFLQCTKLEQREEMKTNFKNLFGLGVKEIIF